MLFDALSDETTIQTIFQYLPYSNQIDFLFTNSVFYDQWYSRFRVIRIRTREDIYHFCGNDDTFRNELLSYITNPRKQISLEDNYHYPLLETHTSCSNNNNNDNNDKRRTKEKEKEILSTLHPFNKVSKTFSFPCFYRLRLPIEFFEYLNFIADENKNEGEGKGIESIESLTLLPTKNDNYNYEKVFPYTRKVSKELELVRWKGALPPLSDTLEHLIIFWREDYNPKLLPLTVLKLKKLTLHYKNISNMDFSYLEELVLQSVFELSDPDLTLFKKVKKLSIILCSNIVDLSCLQDNEEIAILNCKGVVDFSQSFKNSKIITLEPSWDVQSHVRIDLSYYSKVTSFSLRRVTRSIEHLSNFQQVPENLKIVRIREVSFVALHWFSSLSEIEIVECNILTSLAGLGTVSKLRLCSLTSLSSLEGLGAPGNKFVRVEDCHAIVDFSPLKYVTSVEIVDCRGFRDCYEVDHVYDLSLIDCQRVYDVSMLHLVHHLTLLRCNRIRSIAGLTNVSRLEIRDCTNIKRQIEGSIVNKDLGIREISDGLTNLPDNLYPLILDYLFYDERIEWIVSNTYLYQRLYKKYRKFDLNGEEIVSFFNDSGFRGEILARIEDPSNQLRLSDDDQRISPEYLFLRHQSIRLSGLCTLAVRHDFFQTLMESANIPQIRSVALYDSMNTFDLVDPNLNDYLNKASTSLFLRNMIFPPGHNNLNVSPTVTAIIINGCSPQLRLSALPNLSYLYIINSEIMNPISDFQQLEMFEQRDAMSVDLEQFKHVKTLMFEDCSGLTNIESLQTNESVSMIDCEGVNDFRKSFRETKRLKLAFSDPRFISVDFSNYQKIQEICIAGTDFLSFNQHPASDLIPASLRKLQLLAVQNFTQLGMGYEHLRTIEIGFCLQFSSVMGLGSVHTVKLVGLKGLKTLKGLGSGNQFVSVKACPKIKCFSALKKVPNVEIVDCNKFTKASDVAKVQSLRIEGCENLKDVTALQNIDHLELIGCTGVESVKELKNRELIIKDRDDSKGIVENDEALENDEDDSDRSCCIM